MKTCPVGHASDAPAAKIGKAGRPPPVRVNVTRLMALRHLATVATAPTSSGNVVRAGTTRLRPLNSSASVDVDDDANRTPIRAKAFVQLVL